VNYLVDTCVLSELMKRHPEQKVADWIEACPEDALHVSVLTLGEIQKGIAKLADPQNKHRLQTWLDSDLKERFSGRILPVDEAVALAWGQILGECSSRGIAIQTVDGLLGATAVVHNLVVVTRDTGDIGKTGARLLNPWE
jgi:hypothetical protein